MIKTVKTVCSRVTPAAARKKFHRVVDRLLDPLQMQSHESRPGHELFTVMTTMCYLVPNIATSTPRSATGTSKNVFLCHSSCCNYWR
jgi:hypothetical protein